MIRQGGYLTGTVSILVRATNISKELIFYVFGEMQIVGLDGKEFTKLFMFSVPTANNERSKKHRAIYWDQKWFKDGIQPGKSSTVVYGYDFEMSDELSEAFHDDVMAGKFKVKWKIINLTSEERVFDVRNGKALY